MKKITLALIMAVLCLTATVSKDAVAGGHAYYGGYKPYYGYGYGYGGYYGHRPYYGRYGYGFRPVCRVGGLSPGCFAPIRKSARFLGRVGFRAGVAVARGVGFGVRVAVGGVRVAVFGRRFR